MARYCFITICLSVSTILFSSFSSTLSVYARPAQSTQRPLNTQRVRSYVPKFKPPKVGTPLSTVGAGARSESGVCVREGTTPLTAITPSDTVALTTAENTEVFVYIPETQAETMRLVVKDDLDNEVLRKSIPTPNNAGIIRFNLAQLGLTQSLALNKSYRWSFTLMCLPQDRSDDIVVGGWIKRTTLSPGLVKQLSNVTPQQRPSLYAENGIWNEAVISLVELRRSRPQDPTLATYWKELLKSVGLENVAEKPFVQ